VVFREIVRLEDRPKYHFRATRHAAQGYVENDGSINIPYELVKWFLVDRRCRSGKKRKDVLVEHESWLSNTCRAS
jgi:hypothetical protein